MIVARTIADLRTALNHQPPGTRVGLVPTMGAFHAGHVSLFAAARRECDVVVVSLFVNPSQFGDPKDSGDLSTRRGARRRDGRGRGRRCAVHAIR